MYALDYVMRKKIRIVLKRKIQHNIKKKSISYGSQVYSCRDCLKIKCNQSTVIVNAYVSEGFQSTLISIRLF